VVLEQLVAGFAVPSIDSQTLLSMEIFCSSSLEASDRASFLTAVSALARLSQPMVEIDFFGGASV
jgi:hypothetical protein